MLGTFEILGVQAEKARLAFSKHGTPSSFIITDEPTKIIVSPKNSVNAAQTIARILVHEGVSFYYGGQS